MRYVKFWAMLVDLYIYLLTICIGFDLVLGVRKFTETFEIFGKSQLIVWFILILINDLMLGNKSIGKSLFGIEVVDEDGNIPSAWKLIVRNLIFILLFPIEIISVLIFDKTIGDFILKIKVVKESKKNKRIKKGILCIFFSKKKKKNKNRSKGYVVEVEKSVIYGIVILFILILFVFILTTPIDELIKDNCAIITFFILSFLDLLILLHFIKYKIYVRKNEIEKQPIIGKNKIYYYNDIVNIKIKKSKLVSMDLTIKIYFNNKDKIVFDNGYSNFGKFLKTLEENVTPEKFIYK